MYLARRDGKHGHDWGRVEDVDGIRDKQHVDCGMKIEELDF